MQKIFTFAAKKDKLEAIGFSQKEVTKVCIEMIILYKLPFSFVNGEGFRFFACNHVLCGEYLVVRQLLRIYLTCFIPERIN